MGSSAPALSATTNVAAAEQVAARFVGGFEGFSYRDPAAAAAVAHLATPRLAAMVSSPSQAAVGPTLVAEKFTVTATVVGFELESDSPSSVSLLARTAIRTSTVTGSSSSIRLVPVSVEDTDSGWKVSAVDGLTASALREPSSPSSDSPTTVTPPAGSAPSTTSGGADNAPAAAPGSAPPTITAVGDAPAAYVGWMQAAVAAQCPGLPWTVLAGIAKVESDFGRSTLPGVTSGSNAMGAQGPMQFEPATFAAYAVVAPGGADPASPYEPADAIYSAARLLCADGGADPAHLYAAIFDYNHSDAYVALVVAYADEYAQIAADGGSGVVERGLGSVIVADAETYLGTPYVWGGENPGTGFDCSGLVQWVYAQAGISLPRVAQDQYDAGPHLPAGATLYPGDLLFFGSGPSGVEHVGIYVGNGEMIDAPYTGAVVRFDRVADVPLGFVGATRPEIPDLAVGAGVPMIATGNQYPSGDGSASGGRSDAGTGHGSDPGHGESGSGPHRGPSTGPTRPGRHHHTTRTTTTTTTKTTTTTTAPTTTTTAPGTTSTSPPPGRHHPTTTTTPPTTTPPTTTPPTTTPTTPPSSTTTSTAPPSSTTTTSTSSSPSPSTTSTSTSTSTSMSAPPTTAPPTTGSGSGRHHPKGG
jgi:hypothetical protein